MPNIKKSYIYFIILIFIYRITLDYIYSFVISPVWEYQHFYLDVNKTLLILSYIWLFFISAYDYTLFRDERPSSYFLFFTDLLFFIPLSSIIPLSGMTYNFFSYCVIYWFFIYYLHSRYLSKRHDVYNKNNDLIPSKLFIILSFTIVIINFFITVYYNGLNIKFDLKDVYDIRFAVRDLHLPTIVQYIKPLASKITLVLIVVMIIRKKTLIVILLTLLQLMNFAFGALKSDLFALLVAYCIGYIYKPSLKKFIVPALILANFIVIIEYHITSVSVLSIIIHRRVLYMPSLLSYEYYSFFSNNDLVLLRDSFMRYFGFSSPYDLEIPRLIGRELYAREDMNCNTGIIGDDFAQFGWFSLFIFPFIRFQLLKIYDKMSRYIPLKVFIYISFVYSLVFISGTFFSSLLTGGFLFICLLLYVYRK